MADTKGPGPVVTLFTRPIRAPQGQGVTFVELFFDLVFVFAITELTKLAASDLTWSGAGRSVLVAWLIWWAWSQFTWALNPADTDHGIVRGGTLFAGALAFLMAISVGDALGDGGLWFAIPYVAVRVVGLGLYVLVAAEDKVQLAAVRLFGSISTLGLGAAVIGGAVHGNARTWWWLAVIGLDFLAAGLAGSQEGWGIHSAHFAERHGLFVIIALGESLVAAGIAAAGEERTSDLVFVAIGAVIVVSLLWWTYFGWLKDALERRLEAASDTPRAQLARDAYSLLHFPLIVGVVGVAIGVEEMVAHPGDALEAQVLIALIVGVTLFVGSAAAALWRADRTVLVARFAVLGLLAIGAAVQHPAEPKLILSLTIAAVAAVVVAEALQHPHTELQAE